MDRVGYWVEKECLFTLHFSIRGGGGQPVARVGGAFLASRPLPYFCFGKAMNVFTIYLKS